ncbi:MAG: DUF3782 domain-containing protein [Planctomycetes bacterium]|nr:DUF3782 domain-containing protein [Planctomycetota bacterium]
MSRDEMLALLRSDPDVQAEIQRLVMSSAVVQELKALREDMDRRFEALQADMDRRFEAMEARFEAMDKRFEAMDKRFEAMDKRFEALVTRVDEGFRRMDEGFRRMDDRFSALGSRWGIQTEEAVRAFAREFIGREFGVQAERWTQADAELDVVVRNGKDYLIEVKSSTDARDVERFVANASAYERATGRGAARRLLVTAHANSAAWARARAEGVEIISG